MNSFLTYEERMLCIKLTLALIALTLLQAVVA